MQMHEDRLAKMSMHNRQHGYGILDERYHGGQSGREYFARNPGGEWVTYLPEVTHEALWERYRCKFPHGLNPADDIINKPPLA